MNKKRLRTIKRKKISEECWNLNYSFIKWLNEHLRVYKKEASKIVNLEYHTYEYRGRKYTQLEAIDRMIFLSGQMLLDYCDLSDFQEEYKDQLMDLWKLVFDAMWW